MSKKAASPRRLITTAVLVCAALGLMAGGAVAAMAKSTARATKSAAITVWVDAPRVPAVKAFEKAYPNIPVKLNVNNDLPGVSDLEEKFALFNQAGSGWPDAIFFPDNDDVSWASSTKIHYTANLKPLLPAKTVKGYAPAAIAPCVYGTKWECVRNDDAPDVLWYNASLFKQWGYTPPTTWPQYESLSLEIAKNHPGYYTGMLGDAYAPDRYLWASGCPTNDVVGANVVHINTADPKCTRVEKMLDTLLAAKAVSPVGIFDTAAASTVGPKLAMTPGAAWYGVYLFEDTYKIPKGEMTAAAPMKWPGEPVYTGDEGGGMWGASSHISGQVLKNTITFLNFVATDPRWQVNLSTGLPAFGPDQAPWLAGQKKSGYFADFSQLSSAIKTAVTVVRPDHSWLLYNTGAIWTQVVTPALDANQSLSSIWSSFTSTLKSTASSVGYKVK